MKAYYFTYALLLCCLSLSTSLVSVIKNQADRFALSACHSIGGVIKFPSLSTLPQLRIYCSGTKILTDADKSTDSLYYTTPKGSYQYEFSMLITETIDHEMAQEYNDSNTIAFLKIPKGQKYKLFYVQLAARQSCQEGDDLPFEWIIEEKILPESGRIPDDAIIICCNPDFVESVESSHYRDLPTVKIRSDLVQFVGSETKIHDQFNETILATIDCDTLHSKTRQGQSIKITQNKVLIAPSIT